jgi:hypothetical protein
MMDALVPFGPRIGEAPPKPPNGIEADQVEGWGSPLPDGWPELDQAAYHGLAGEIVLAIAPHTEADPVGILVQLLVKSGNAIGRGPFYSVEGDKHYTNLFALLMGATSKGRKGTGAGRVTQVVETVDPDWQHECVRSGLASGEGLIWTVRDAISGPVKVGKGQNVQFVVKVIDPGVSDKRLLVFEAEFARALAAMKRDGNTLSPVIRDMWDRGDLAITTKNSPVKATGVHGSIIGHCTVDELRAELDHVSLVNGFQNRFLHVCVRRVQELPFGGALDAMLMLDYVDRVQRVLEWSRQQQRIGFTAAAAALWEAGYHDLSTAQPGILGAVTARAEAQVVRLGLLYALFDQSPAIDVPHLNAALAVWKYCAASAGYVFGDALGHPVADEILRVLRACAPEGMTRSEISAHFGRNLSSSQLGKALELLLTHAKVRWDRRPSGRRGGRPVEIWIAI